ESHVMPGPITMPIPGPAFVTVTVCLTSVNVAVTVFVSASVTSHVVASPVHAPDQPVNVEPSAGAAVSVTIAFCAKAPSHVAPHEMPDGDDVIVPAPFPAFTTCRSTRLGVSTTTEPS